MTVAGVLLAAGAGSRFREQTHKLRATIGEKTVIELALESLEAAGLDEVVVVVGAVELADLIGSTVTIVDNPEWEQGQATSLQAAVRHCRHAGHEAMVVGLGDQPGIDPASWSALAAETSAVAVATYEGHRGNPVRLSADVWDLLPVEGDEGARPLIRARPDLVTAVRCSGRSDDIDTTEDLLRWN